MDQEAYPKDITVPDDVRLFFERFYQTSDTPDIHEEYCNFFKTDATFILASKNNQGRDAILQTRKSMWSGITARKHTVYNVYPFGNLAKSFMLCGKVEYKFANGKTSEKDWAARAVLEKDQHTGDVQFQFYQIYLDTLLHDQDLS